MHVSTIIVKTRNSRTNKILLFYNMNNYCSSSTLLAGRLGRQDTTATTQPASNEFHQSRSHRLIESNTSMYNRCGYTNLNNCMAD